MRVQQLSLTQKAVPQARTGAAPGPSCRLHYYGFSEAGSSVGTQRIIYLRWYIES